MNDIEEIERGVVTIVERGIVNLFVVFVSIGLLLWYNAELALISIIFLPFLAFPLLQS